MIVTLRLAEEKIKEPQFQGGGDTPKTLRFADSVAGASPSERESPGACDKMPRDKVSHPYILCCILATPLNSPGESYPQVIHN